MDDKRSRSSTKPVSEPLKLTLLWRNSHSKKHYLLQLLTFFSRTYQQCSWLKLNRVLEVLCQPTQKLQKLRFASTLNCALWLVHTWIWHFSMKQTSSFFVKSAHLIQLTILNVFMYYSLGQLSNVLWLDGRHCISSKIRASKTAGLWKNLACIWKNW